MLTTDFIRHLYETFIQEDCYNWYHDWYQRFKMAGDFLGTLRMKLAQGGSLDDAAIQATEGHPWGGDKKDLDSFLDYYWRVNDNGVTTVALGQISSDSFNLLRAYDAGSAYNNLSFVDLTREIILKGDPKEALELMSNWFDLFCSQHKVRRPYAVMKRWLCTQHPGRFTTLVSDQMIDFLIQNVPITNSAPLSNWLDRNIILTEILSPLGSVSGDDEYTRSIFFHYLYEFLRSPLQINKQTVLYGSPGTGKTYKAKRIARDYYEAWKSSSGSDKPEFDEVYRVVQFHPSFAYEDFVEGIRPGNVGTGGAQLALVNGVFKEFCKNAAIWEFDYYGTDYFKSLRNTNREAPGFEALTVKEVQEKTDLCAKDHWKHIKGKPEDDPVLRYIPPFFFVIDEINRAELSRVLGELMYCLEYRGYGGKVQTQYSNLVTTNKDAAAFWYENDKNYFFVPHNVYLVGTMNIIDRSVESFDFALRRRFSWERIDPNPLVLKAILTKKASDKGTREISAEVGNRIDAIANSMKVLNEAIENHPLLGPDFKIGHTYFIEVHNYIENEATGDILKRVWNGRLKSLLEEYLRGLGDQKRIDTQIQELEKGFRRVRSEEA